MLIVPIYTHTGELLVEAPKIRAASGFALSRSDALPGAFGVHAGRPRPPA
jgi:hypothetical protein